MAKDYEIVIWLEIHIKLNSETKLFCSCPNVQNFDELKPNENICSVCTGQPWALPVLQEWALKKWIKLWLALNCTINKFSNFDRKSYFYPDLPIGYQITQLFHPTNTDGEVSFFVDNYKEEKKVKILQAHMEADAGKTIHEWWKAHLDYNRAATPLVEIVTYPDFRSDDEVVEFLKELQRLVRFNNVWDADLEKGQMRCDVNISLRERWVETLGTRAELKNMNSFSAIKRAINHEYKRQKKILEAWKEVDQETRGWNDEKWSSYTMRSKEDALDYRYFPEPDLPPLELTDEFIEEQKVGLVKSAFTRAKQYKEEYWFSKEYITPLISDLEISDYFEKLVQDGIKSKNAARWIVNTLLRYLNDENISLSDVKFSYDDFKYLLEKEQNWEILGNQAKDVFKEMITNGKTPAQVIEEKWFKAQDDGELESIISEILKENAQAVEDIKAGKMNAIGFLVGQVMKKTQWKSNPAKAKEMIIKIVG